MIQEEDYLTSHMESIGAVRKKDSLNIPDPTPETMADPLENHLRSIGSLREKEKPRGLPYGEIAKDTLADVARKLTTPLKQAGEHIVGLGEAGVSAMSGLASFPVSWAGGLGAKTFGGKSWQEARDISQNISQFMTHEPTTEKGKVYTDIAMSPFAALGWLTEKGTEKMAEGDPETQAMLTFASEAALLTLLPHLKGGAKKAIQRTVEQGKAIPSKLFKKLAEKSEAPPPMKQQIQQIPDTVVIKTQAKPKTIPEKLPTKVKPPVKQPLTETEQIKAYEKSGKVEKVKAGEFSEQYKKGIEKDVKGIKESLKKAEEFEVAGDLQKTTAPELKEYYTGPPATKAIKAVGEKIIDGLQVEPRFKRIDAPKTGQSFKLYHPTRSTELKRGSHFIKQVEQSKLKPKDYETLTYTASTPTKLAKMIPTERQKLLEPQRKVREFFDYYKQELKKRDVPAEWPASQLKDLESMRLSQMKRLGKKDVSKTDAIKIKQDLQDINTAINFIKKSDLQYVHIPRTWMEDLWQSRPEDSHILISQFFKNRKTYDIESLAKYLLEKKVIKPADVDIRNVMAAYSHKVGHKLAIADIIQSAKQEGLVKLSEGAPKDFQGLPSRYFPTLKKYKAHPVFVDYFEKNLSRRKFGLGLGKGGAVLGGIKMMQFYNPLFLPAYDIKQAWWSGSVRSLKTPKAIFRAAKSMKNRDMDYWEASANGAFSTPFTPGFNSYAKQIKGMIDGNKFLKRLKKYGVNPYHLSWDLAWYGDNFIRMITHHYYRMKDFAPREAAQLTAKMHGDYASIPPKTRKWMNKIFFTPSFKIAMASAQAEMVSSTGKMILKAGKVSPHSKAMSKALVGLASGILLRHITLSKLGFKQDQFGLKYKKTVTIEGEEKELVLHTASPDNIYLRFYHRFKGIPTEEDKIGAFLDRAKWELHPAWQLAHEISGNKSVEFTAIYNPFDSKAEIAKDVVKYSATRIVGVLREFEGMGQTEKRAASYKALQKDVGKIGGSILRWFSLPYTRSPEERRVGYEIRELQSLFKYMAGQAPPRNDKEANERIDVFQKKVKEIIGRLEKK